MTESRGGLLRLNLVKCHNCSLKPHQSEEQGIYKIISATQELLHNEPSLIQNLQAESRADLSRHH